MDKKKIIGTIIGVVAFVALVAGATYAWYTYSIELNKDSYNFVSTKFSIQYGKGQDITLVPIFTGLPSRTDFSDDTTIGGHLSVTAKTISDSVPGLITIYLHVNPKDTTNNTGTDSELIPAIRYAVCEGSTSIADTPYKGFLDDITADTNNNYDLTYISATASENVALQLTDSATPKTFHVYFWLDAETLTDELDGKDFSGYIGARAIQLH